jgi:hypothetical protein
MFPLVNIQYHGDVDIAYWEYTLALVYLFVLYLWAARRKNQMIKKAPEYRYFIWGLLAKVFGGAVFSFIYFYYYEGGDTISYFFSAVSMSKLAAKDFLAYLHVLFGEISYENRSYFDMDTGWPYGYVYFDPRSFFVIRTISPLVIITFNSYLVTTIVLATLSYLGIWNCFRTFVSYYPSLMHKLAIAFLFMPSVIFWGSAILKDTFTLSAMCWWIYCMDQIYFKKRSIQANAFGLFLSAVFMVVMKPYIFMVLIPVTLLWVFHSRITAIRNGLVKFLVLPLATIALMVFSINVMEWMADRLDKFSLDRALRTIEVIQADMKRTEQYGSGYFDIGELDGTWLGVLKKFPVATNAALFRPYVWESGSATMFISALENLWLLLLVMGMLWRTRILFFIRCMFGNPLVMLSLVFALLFGFTIGVTTPNFGALVRFKIPLIPLLVAGVFIIGHLNDRRRYLMSQGRVFNLGDYTHGDPIAKAVREKETDPVKRPRRPGWKRA